VAASARPGRHGCGDVGFGMERAPHPVIIIRLPDGHRAGPFPVRASPRAGLRAARGPLRQPLLGRM